MIRPLLFASALALVAPVAFAQQPCTNGFATLAAPVPGAPTQGPFPCNGVDLLAYVPSGTTGPLRAPALSDIWGWTDPETGHEYALSSTVNGTVFVDVTDPVNPAVLGRLATRTGEAVWRDVKVYADHAFIVSDGNGNHGMQVFDLRTLRGLAADPARNFTATTVFDGPAGTTVGSKHNIVIDEASGFAYLVGGSSCSGGLYMVDIRTPASPAFAGCYGGSGYTHDAQCLTYYGPDTDYAGREICFNSNGNSGTPGNNFLVIVDVTDKASPQLISSSFYPNPSYTHQGWLTDDGRHFLLDDEIDSSAGGTRTLVMDVEDLDNPSFAFQHLGAVPTTDHNQYVLGRYTFQSNYTGGLRILDLAALDAEQMPEVASFDTYPQNNAESYSGQWSNYPYFASGIVVANDRSNGLFILRPTTLTVGDAPPPAAASFALGAPSPNPARDTATLTLTVAAPAAVRAVVLDATGREVATVFDGTVADATTLSVDTRALPSGVYALRVTSATFSATRRLTVAH
jgi:choice-of-anchor B domain-containing protein